MRRSNVTIAAALLALALAACGSTTTVVNQRTPTPTARRRLARDHGADHDEPVDGHGTSHDDQHASPQAGRRDRLDAGMRRVDAEARLPRGQGATGHGELGFSLTNTSTQSCHAYGYPSIQFRTASGQRAADEHDPHDPRFFGTAPPPS